MKIADIRKYIKSKYRLGQQVTLKINDCERYGGDKITVTIVGFYPESILTERKGFKESFRYWDFLKMTTKIKDEKVKNEKTGHHKNRAAS